MNREKAAIISKQRNQQEDDLKILFFVASANMQIKGEEESQSNLPEWIFLLFASSFNLEYRVGYARKSG